ncbi:MAG: Hsp70 family protein [Acidimicrobiales bacterium]
MGGIVGIDLGTTYSCVACVDEYARPKVLANFDGDLTSPSVILFAGPDDYVSGKQAKRQALIEPHNVCSLVKRRMSDSQWRFTAFGKSWSASGVSSLILRALCTDAALGSGTAIDDVVITVPAYFGDEERRATRLAGEHAGLSVIDIINEPTAAALAYGLMDCEVVTKGVGRETVLVFDLGGGTFDITIIELSDLRISVVATDGDRELGGADWDERLATELSRRFLAACPGAEDPLDDSYAAQQLLSQAEETKRALSERKAVDTLIVHDDNRATITVTAAELEELTASLLQRTIDLTHSALYHARQRGIETIDRLLLVGGSSKMPAVARAMASEFGLRPELVDPDLTVAKGAALYGRKRQLEREVLADLQTNGRIRQGDGMDRAAPRDLDGALGRVAQAHGLAVSAVRQLVSIKVNNVCSRGFGVVAQDETQRRYAHFLVRRNDRLPVAVSEQFGTIVDDQEHVRVVVFEQAGGAESRRLEDNNILTEGIIEGIPPGYPAGTDIEVTFTMGYDGLLEVTASHAALDHALRLRVETESLVNERTAAEREQLSNLRRRQF